MSGSEGETLRVAVFGVGHLGQHHARIWKEMPGAELVAIIDADEKARRSIAKKLKCPGFAPGEDLPQFDCASVAVPTQLHHSVAGPMLDAGIHVLVEKPLAGTVADARDLVDRAAAGGAILSVGHVERFNPALDAAREQKLDPKFIEVHRVSPFSFRSADVGVVLDMMIHDIDVILALVRRPVEEIRAVGAAFIAEHEDVANVRLQFEGGCVACLTASRVALKTERKFRIFSPDAYVSMDFSEKKATIITKNREISAEALGIDPSSASDLRKLAGKIAFGDFLDVRKIKMDSKEQLRLELEAFAASLRGAPPVVTGEDGYDAVALAERIRVCIAEHSWT